MLLLENIAAYSIQLAVLTSLALLASRLLNVTSPGAAVRFWQIALAVAVVLPLLQPWRDVSGGLVSATSKYVVGVLATEASSQESVPFDLVQLLIVLITAGMGLRIGWFVVGLLRVRRLRERSERLATLGAFVGELQASLNTNAEVRVSDEVSGPATMGLTRPVVLLPKRTLDLPEAVQRSILCHELFHVRRFDWLQSAVAELWCALLWFHPGARLLVSRWTLAREIATDRDSVTHTGDRRAYAAAMLAFADESAVGLTTLASFTPRRHLSQRIAHLTQECSMSSMRIGVGLTFALLVVSIGTMVAASRVPLGGTLLQRTGGEPYSPGNGVSLPVVVKEVKPDYPQAAKDAKVQGDVELSVVVLASGAVDAVKVVKSLDSNYGLDDAAIAAARQWQFKPGLKDGKPVDVRVTVAMRFALK